MGTVMLRAIKNPSTTVTRIAKIIARATMPVDSLIVFSMLLISVDEYLKGRSLYHTQKRAPNSSTIETDRSNLEKKTVDAVDRKSVV